MFQSAKQFLFKNTSDKQTVAKNTFWLTAGIAVSRIIKTVLIIYAARVLGTEGYGVFSYALSLVGFFSILSDIGLSPLLTREVVKRPDKAQAYLSTIFILKITLLVMAVLITIFVAPLFTKIAAAKPLIFVAAIIIAFDSLRSFGFSITRAQNKMEYEAILNIIADLLITVLGVLALMVKPTAFYLSISYAAGNILGFGIILIVLRKQFKDIFKYFDRNLIAPILTDAWPFAISAVMAAFLVNIDTIIIGWYRTANELGLYSASQRPVLFLYLVPALLASSTFPLLSRFVRENDKVNIKIVTEKSIKVLLLIALPITFGGIILGLPLIKIIFGQAYVGATSAFQVLLSTIIFVFPGAIINGVLFAYNKQRVSVFAAAIGAFLNFVLDLILIPILGIVGSSIATLISQGFFTIYTWLFIKKMNDFKIFFHIRKIIVSTLLMSLVSLLLKYFGLNILLNILISMIFYFGILYILKEPILKEVRQIISG